MFFSLIISIYTYRDLSAEVKLVHGDVRIGIVKYRGSWLLHNDIFFGHCASIMMHNITIAM